MHTVLKLKIPFLWNVILCQFTPFLDSYSLVCGLKPFGCLHSTTLTCYFWCEYHFRFTPTLLSGTQPEGKTRAGFTSRKGQQQSSQIKQIN